MAVVLTWVLFLAWSMIGLAVLRLGRHRWSLATILLAPTVGFAALTVPVYMVVRTGLPVRATAVPVGAALLTLSAIVLWRLRPAPARAARLWKRSRAFLVVLAAAFGLSAWPMFGYGFDWVANGNDDMANYCLIATGYRDHGYVRVPTLEELSGGLEPTQTFWPIFILLQVRPGSEVLLAQVSAWTGLSVQPVFMPTLVALHLTLVAAVGGLTAVGAGRRASLVACTLLAVSGASAYGIVWQLIGQVSGLALLCTALALVSARFRRVPARVLIGRAGACGLVFAGLLAFYPEVIPILVGGCVVLGVRELLRGRLDRRHLSHAGAAIAVMAALLPVYLYGAATFIAWQSQQGKGSETAIEVFPFFMTPQGPALFWGLLPILGPEPPLVRNACIALGFVFLGAVLLPTASGVRRNRAFAAALCVVALMTAVLYANRAGFGLFKIAMFAQPFLWAVVGAWAAARRGRWAGGAAVGLVLVVGGLNARVQFWYVDQSRGAENRVEVPALTARRGLTAFRAEYARHAAAGTVDRVILATENNVLLKLLAAEVRGVPVEEAGVHPLAAQAHAGLSYTDLSPPWLRLNREWRDPLVALREELVARADRDRVPVRDPDTGRVLHRPLHALPDRTAGPPERVLVVAGGGAVSVFNRYRFPEARSLAVCAPLTEFRNFAVFCDATGARQHFLGMGEPDSVALYQLETDPFFRKRTMAAVGRALVLDVFNPDPQVRVLVECTASFKADPGQRSLPDVRVVGDRHTALGLSGIGAARLVSPPVGLQAAGPGRFLAFSFGEPVRNANNLSGLERLWGANLARDRRRLTGHLRDVSVLSEDEYAAFKPPERVSAFPADLGHPHLEFSGVCEDGWVGAAFKVRLTQPAPGQEAVIRGQIPLLPENPEFRTTAVVRVDGREVETRSLGPGEFEIRAPSGAGPGPRWVEVTFSDVQALPAPDGRRAVAHLRSVGFENRDEAQSRPPGRLAAFPADLRHPKAEAVGVFEDGWCAGTFAARLWHPGGGAEAVVRGTVPELPGGGAFRTEVRVLLDGTEVARKELAPGTFELRAPAAGNAAQGRRLECRFTNTQALPAPDGRSVGAHLQFVGFEPPAPGQ